jgi:aryl-alcohol dehydrogenase-like predicted oxidoreductase
LGRTGLRVSPLCLGTMNFGNQAEEAEGHRIMDRALELGINFFDTANVYGAPGLPTEEIIGRWLVQGERRRERTVIATKVYGGRDAWPNTSRLSARHIRESCERSLRRMQTDYIDLYQMHHVDRDTPWDEIWQAMELLVHQGKILYVGSSNFAGWHIVKANERAARRNFLGLVSEQSLYNLNARTVELEVLRRVRTTASASSRGVRSAAASSAAPCRTSPRGAAAPSGCSGRSSGCDRHSKRGRSCAQTTAHNPPTWRWPGSCTTRG